MALSSFESLNQILKEVSKISIVYSLDPESLICAATIANLASSKEIDFELAPFFEAQKPLDSSSLLLLCGVRQQKVVGGIRIKLLQDILGVKRFALLKLIKEVREIWIVSAEQVALAIASVIAFHQGCSYDDQLLATLRNELGEFISSGIISINENTLRLFRYPHAKISECLFRTIEPYALGISLSVNGSRAIIEELGIPDREGPLEKTSLEELRKKLKEIYSSYLVKGFEPLGWKIIVRSQQLLDVNELAYAIIASIDAGLHELAISTFFDHRYSKALMGALERFYESIARFMEEALRGERKGGRMYLRGIRVEQWEASLNDPLNTIAKLLRAHGVASSLVTFRVEDGYCVPLSQVSPSWPFEVGELSFVNGCACSSSMDKLIKVLI